VTGTGASDDTNRRGDGRERPAWTFLTNHGHVLVCIANDPGIRGRDIAERVGITERATQSIVADLVEAGYVRRTRVGRRNHYEVIPNRPFRHPVEQPHSIGELVELVSQKSEPASRASTRRRH
jgi:predicted transcriptional regulator